MKVDCESRGTLILNNLNAEDCRCEQGPAQGLNFCQTVEPPFGPLFLEFLPFKDGECGWVAAK